MIHPSRPVDDFIDGRDESKEMEEEKLRKKVLAVIRDPREPGYLKCYRTTWEYVLKNARYPATDVIRDMLADGTLVQIRSGILMHRSNKKARAA